MTRRNLTNGLVRCVFGAAGVALGAGCILPEGGRGDLGRPDRKGGPAEPEEVPRRVLLDTALAARAVEECEPAGLPCGAGSGVPFMFLAWHWPDEWGPAERSLYRARSWSLWELAVTGPGGAAPPRGRALFDLDGDCDVDLADFAALQCELGAAGGTSQARGNCYSCYPGRALAVKSRTGRGNCYLCNFLRSRRRKSSGKRGTVQLGSSSGAAIEGGAGTVRRITCGAGGEPGVSRGTVQLGSSSGVEPVGALCWARGPGGPAGRVLLDEGLVPGHSVEGGLVVPEGWLKLGGPGPAPRGRADHHGGAMGIPVTTWSTGGAAGAAPGQQGERITTAGGLDSRARRCGAAGRLEVLHRLRRRSEEVPA